MASETRRIQIITDVGNNEGLKAVAKMLGNINKEVTKSASSLDYFKNAFNSLAGLSIAGIGVGQFTQMADAMTLATGRLEIFTGSAEAAKETMEGLFQVANDTKQGFAETANTFNRFSLVLKDVGASSGEVLAVTKSLNNIFRLANSSAGETNSVLIQLSQAFASGEVRGQELRAILEANAIFGEILAKQLNVTRGELLKMGEAGKITSDVVLKALANNFTDIDQKTKLMNQTFEQTTILLKNQLIKVIGELNKEFGLSNGFAKFADFIIKNGTGVTSALLALGAAIYFVGIKSAATSVYFTLLGTTSAVGASGVSALALSVFGLQAAFIAVTKYVAIFAAAFAVFYAFQDFEAFMFRFTQAMYGLGYAINEVVGILYKDGGEAGRKFFTQKIEDTQKLEKALKRSKGSFTDFQKELNNLNKKGDRKKEEQSLSSIAKLNQAYSNGRVKVKEYEDQLKKLQVAEVYDSFNKGTIVLKERDKQINEILYGKTKKSTKFDEVMKLNEAFRNNKITVEQYRDALPDAKLAVLDYQLKKGTRSLDEVNEAMSEIKISKLNMELGKGVLTWQQYRDKVIEVKNLELGNSFASGAISAAEFNAELTKLNEKFMPGAAIYTGINNYINAAGTLNQNIASGIENTFNALENRMMDFFETGRFNFRAFADDIIKELNRIIIRSLIIRPLAQGILGAIDTTPTGTSTQVSNGSEITSSIRQEAKGDAFNSSGVIKAFAKGGVVDSPTGFRYGNNQRGLMGEAGPEAIIPLKRASNGDLGVTAVAPIVNVNVVNNSSAEVETRESTNSDGSKNIELFIVNKVKESISNGSMDSLFANNFGLRRRGY
jgi:lambda family phage tail tape measure protein